MEPVKVPQHLDLEDVLIWGLGAIDLVILVAGGMGAWWLYLALPIPFGARLVIAVAAGDQLSKWWLYEYLVAEGRRQIELLPFINLVAVWNYGVSFGMFNSGSTAASWIFIIVALAIVASIF